MISIRLPRGSVRYYPIEAIERLITRENVRSADAFLTELSSPVLPTLHEGRYVTVIEPLGVRPSNRCHGLGTSSCALTMPVGALGDGRIELPHSTEPRG